MQHWHSLVTLSKPVERVIRCSISNRCVSRSFIWAYSSENIWRVKCSESSLNKVNRRSIRYIIYRYPRSLQSTWTLNETGSLSPVARPFYWHAPKVAKSFLALGRFSRKDSVRWVHPRHGGCTVLMPRKIIITGAYSEAYFHDTSRKERDR